MCRYCFPVRLTGTRLINLFIIPLIYTENVFNFRKLGFNESASLSRYNFHYKMDLKNIIIFADRILYLYVYM